MMSSLIAGLLSLQPAHDPQRVDASWLEGCWQGEGLGHQVMECWMSGPDGRMTGMFQMFNPDGSQRFSEIFVMGYFDGTYELRLKHFNPDMTSWEGKDDYVSWPLVSHQENQIVLEDYTMTREGDAFRVELVINNQSGPQTAVFEYTRFTLGED